ncbi:MAG: UDP-N-acetylmuramoyl-tripeptide--D-alanyl-D-alanine ligase [Candidatus Delongbacteria bacterium]
MKLKDLLNCDSVISYEFADTGQKVRGGGIDSRTLEHDEIYFCLKGARADGHDFISQLKDKAAVSVVDRDFINTERYPVIYSKNVEKTLAEFAAKWRKYHKAKIFAITGSNGKTTTKEMLVKILSENKNIVFTHKNNNNHIGVPLTLFNIGSDTETAIVEMGTNSPGEIKFLTRICDPDAGLITNIGDAHLEKLGDKDGVYKEKTALFEYLYKKGGRTVVNTDDEYLKNWDRGDIVTYGSSQEADHWFENIRVTDSGYPEFDYRGLPIRMKVAGLLNIKNALAAAACASVLSIDKKQIAKGLKEYTSFEKRYEQIKIKNSSVLLDCYNANPTSVEEFLKDLSSMNPEYTVILGDMHELGKDAVSYHAGVIKKAADLGFKKIFLTGELMKEALKTIDRIDNIKHFTQFKELRSAFEQETENGSFIAIKGSRRAELEKLLEGIDVKYNKE